MGKVKPNFSGREHRGSIPWPILPKRLREVIISAPKKPRPSK